MGKDHKGQPGGDNKNEGLGKTMPPSNLESDGQRTDDQKRDPDELQDDVKVRHPNRNTNKDNDAGPPYA